MARLQILELPEGTSDDRPPFILVVDQYVARRYVMGVGQTEQPIDEFDGIAEKIGARAVLVFEETIDIPANDITADLAGGSDVRNEVTLKVGDQHVHDAIAADMHRMREQAGLATPKTRRDWCCSLAFQTLGKQHIDDCPQTSTT